VVLRHELMIRRFQLHVGRKRRYIQDVKGIVQFASPMAASRWRGAPRHRR
jgi:hypothetical protein